jgi:hypothetical protein
MESTQEHTEGHVTKAIENQTAKLPSDMFLAAALAAMGISLTLKLMKEDHKALFFGQWVAPVLLFGIYNKVVKTQGNDRQSQ